MSTNTHEARVVRDIDWRQGRKSERAFTTTPVVVPAGPRATVYRGGVFYSADDQPVGGEPKARSPRKAVPVNGRTPPVRRAEKPQATAPAPPPVPVVEPIVEIVPTELVLDSFQAIEDTAQSLLLELDARRDQQVVAEEARKKAEEAAEYQRLRIDEEVAEELRQRLAEIQRCDQQRAAAENARIEEARHEAQRRATKAAAAEVVNLAKAFGSGRDAPTTVPTPVKKAKKIKKAPGAGVPLAELQQMGAFKAPEVVAKAPPMCLEHWFEKDDRPEESASPKPLATHPGKAALIARIHALDGDVVGRIHRDARQMASRWPTKATMIEVVKTHALDPEKSVESSAKLLTVISFVEACEKAAAKNRGDRRNKRR